MQNMLEIPLVSDKPGIVVKISGDKETIIKFFTIVFKDLEALPRLQINDPQDGDQKHTAYIYMNFKNQDELKKTVEKLEGYLKEISNISWEIIPLKKYGIYYTLEDVPSLYIGGIKDPLVAICLSRYVRIFETLYKCMGMGSYVIVNRFGKENGKWIAERHERVVRTLIGQGKIRDIVELLFKVLSHLKNLPRSEVTQEERKIKVIFKRDKYFKDIMPLIIRFAYGIVSGCLEALGYNPITEVDVKHGKGIKEIRTEIDGKTWTLAISSEE